MFLSLFLNFIKTTDYLEDIVIPKDFLSNENYLTVQNICKKLDSELDEIIKNKILFKKIEIKLLNEKTEKINKHRIETEIRTKEMLERTNLLLSKPKTGFDFKNTLPLSSQCSTQPAQSADFYMKLPSTNKSFNDYSLKQCQSNYESVIPFNGFIDSQPSTSKGYFCNNENAFDNSEPLDLTIQKTEYFYSDENDYSESNKFNFFCDQTTQQSSDDLSFKIKQEGDDYFEETENKDVNEVQVGFKDYECMEATNNLSLENINFIDEAQLTIYKNLDYQKLVKISELIDILKNIPALDQFKNFKKFEIERIIIVLSNQNKLPKNALSHYFIFKSDIARIKSKVKNQILNYFK